MPGLWDMHVHFGGGEALIEENRDLMPLYVAHGITAVRDAAGNLSAERVGLARHILRARCSARHIFTSGPKIEGINSSGRRLEIGTRPMSTPRWTGCRRCASTSSRSPTTR